MGRLGPYSSLAVPAVQEEQDDPGIRGDTFRRNVSFLKMYLLHIVRTVWTVASQTRKLSSLQIVCRSNPKYPPHLSLRTLKYKIFNT